MTRRQRVLVTGASGCLGHYVVRELLAHTDHALTLAVRDPGRLRIACGDDTRLRIVSCDLAVRDGHDALTEGVDAAVLAATSWGGGPRGDDAMRVNVDGTLALLDALRRDGCSRTVYVSTASLLAHDGSALPEAERIGTPYIRSKAEARRAIMGLAAEAAVIVLYPTLVIGGDPIAPRSHLARLLDELVRRARWLRFVRAEGSFHLAHAADIAQVTRHLIDAPELPREEREVIVGGPPVQVDEAIDALLRYAGRPRRRRTVHLGPALIEHAIRLFRVQLAPWDRFCLTQRHFTYRDARGPSDFGLVSRFPTLDAMLADALAGPR